MKTKIFQLLTIFLLTFTSLPTVSAANPEVMKVGVFITNIHDINFAQKEFSASFWIWFLHSGTYKNPENFFEIVNSKKMSILHRSEHKLPNGQTLNLAKVSATMIEKWDLRPFPFDAHELKIQLEVLGHSAKEIIYDVDCKNSILLKETIQDSLDGWHVIGYDIKPSIETYPSSFGNPITSDYDAFSMATPTLYIKRDWSAEFSRLFLTLYFSFLLALLSVLLPHERLSSKITLVSISVAAIIVSKFVVDSYLTSSGGFSLYSTIELITMWSIFVIVVYDIALHVTPNYQSLKTTKARTIVFFMMLCLYVALNSIWIMQSYRHHKHVFRDTPTVCNINTTQSHITETDIHKYIEKIKN